MAFRIDMTAAARRHLAAAHKLRPQHDAVAGYLFGLAAECAIKAMAPIVAELRDNDVLFAHFPALRTLARERLQGRRYGHQLRRAVENQSFMNEWDVTVRYARTGEVSAKLVDNWARDASDVVALVETL